MNPKTHHISIAARVCLLLAITGLCLDAGAAHGQYTDLHDFGGTVTLSNGSTGEDGIQPGGAPTSAVVIDIFGNVFGTASHGGLYGKGMVWEMTGAGTYIDLHDFGGPIVDAEGQNATDGFEPVASVTFDSAGNLYGIAWVGGPYLDADKDDYGGVLWELTAASEYTQYIDLHDFGGSTILTNGSTGPDGDLATSVTVDSNGNLYGTASQGGLYTQSQSGPFDVGMVWELTKNGSYHDLHDFGGNITVSSGQSGIDGFYPIAGVTFDPAGNMYGTTLYGGAAQQPFSGGIAWELTKASGYTDYVDLHDFGLTVTNADGLSGPDGNSPGSPIAIDSIGNLYGTTEAGGPNDGGNAGNLWQITTGGNYIDLHDFGAQLSGIEDDGESPYGPVAIDSAGEVYGTTQSGGDPVTEPDNSTAYPGVLWIWRPNGPYSILHDFGLPITTSYGTSGIDGMYPSGVAIATDGNIVGTAFYGGANGVTGGEPGYGLLWEEVPPPQMPAISPSTGEYIGALTVGITDGTPGASIYYTTDGSTPIAGDTAEQYAAAFTIDADTTVEAIAVDNGQSSPPSTTIFSIRAADPTFSDGCRHISSPINLTMADATPNASIYYTLDGSAPSPGAADTFHYHGVSVVVEPGTTVEAIATLDGGRRSGTKITKFPAIPPPAAPNFTPPAGEYVTSVNAGLADTTGGVDVYYTTDGSTPVPGAGTTQLYTGSITLTESTTVKAIAAYTSGAGSGPVASAAYVIQAAAPVITPCGEAISSAIDITLSDATPGASIYYTLDGGIPSPGAADTFHWHGTPFNIEPNTTVTALATIAGDQRSGTITATYP